MTASTSAPETEPTSTPAAESVAWHSLRIEEVCSNLAVDPHTGVDATEAERRRAQFGPNKFAETAVEPRWRAFVRQYRDPMQIVLLVAAIGSIWPLHELGTGLVLLFLTLFNAVLGLRQEGKAAEAVAALQKMMIVKAKVRRGGELVEVAAEQLVPGDIVAIEAGDVVPADGRLLKAATLEVAESALTGESMPVAKRAGAKVFAATVNGEGLLRCRATGVGRDTMLAGIVRLVALAQGSKAPVQQLAD